MHTFMAVLTVNCWITFTFRFAFCICFLSVLISAVLFLYCLLCCVRFIFSVVSQEIGWEERLGNDLFCVVCKVGRKVSTQ